jgi:hypothetical protein
MRFSSNIARILQARKQKNGKFLTGFRKWRAEAQLTQKKKLTDTKKSPPATARLGHV